MATKKSNNIQSVPTKEKKLEGRMNATTKQLEKIIVFDNAFRLTLRDNGNTWKDIQRHLEQQSAKDNRKYPTGRCQIFDYKSYFETSLGAEFQKGRNGRATIFNYKDRNCVLEKLIKLIGERQKDSGKELLHALEQSNDSSPLAIWTRLFLRMMLNKKECSDNVLSFYENIDIQGLEHFETLMKHILNKQPLMIFYKPRDKKELLENGDNITMKEANRYIHKVHPYLLKNYNQRWYLVTKELRHDREGNPTYYNTYNFFALDCIDSLKWSDGRIKVPAIACWNEKFIECDEEDLTDFFTDRIGVCSSRQGREEVILRFNKARFDYVATKPIVGTQRNLKPKDEFYDEEYPTIRIAVHITKELEQQVLSFGDDVEVLAPEHFRKRIAEKINNMANKYK